jgi:hypothetical protein
LNLLGPARAARAAAVGLEVAASVVDPERLAVGVAALRAQTTFQVVHWRPVSLALGDAGAAVVCAALDARSPDAGWDRAGHRFLHHAAAGLSDPAVPLSLFSGACGVAAAAWLSSRAGRRYRALREGLDRRLLPVVVPRAPDIVDDLIHGISGWVAYLLLGSGGPDREAALGATTTALATTTTSNLRRAGPGLAHGLAGPLAALSLARTHSAVPPSVDEAIHRLARELTAMVDADGSAGTAWCTETPGIARALWLAGGAVDDDRYRRAGIALALASLRQPARDRDYRTPTLCHGIAGHLLITALFWWDTAEPGFRAGARELCDHLLTRYQPETVFGFRDREHARRPVDNPGLLCGAAGVALVLLALAADQPPVWSRLFLLA